MCGFVHDPDTSFWVLGDDGYSVWARAVGTLKEVIPLVPNLDDIAAAIEDVDAVLPSTSPSAENVP